MSIFNEKLFERQLTAKTAMGVSYICWKVWKNQILEESTIRSRLCRTNP